MSTANGFSALPDPPPIEVDEEFVANFSLPQEALDFVPDESALISKFAGGDQERKIHCNIELRPDELEQVKLLQDEARRLGRSYYTSITVMATRYISYARGNVAKAIFMMDETQAWRTDYFGDGPLMPNQLQDDLSRGILYFTGRDFMMRPILIIRAERLPAEWHKDGTGVTRLIRMLVFCMEYLRRYMFVPGKIENIVVLVDLKNLGIADVPLKALKSIYSVLSHHYIVRVFKFYIVNMSAWLGTLVSVIKPILTDRQRQKLNFLKGPEECKSWVALHHLEEDLGGTRPKITKFFPFPLLPGPFEGGSTAGPRPNAVENCHRAMTAEGFRGRIWDVTRSPEENMNYEYTEHAEDIFKACGLKIPANCPLKAKEPPPAEKPEPVAKDVDGTNGRKKFIVCLDDPVFPWEKEAAKADTGTAKKEVSEKVSAGPEASQPMREEPTKTSTQTNASSTPADSRPIADNREGPQASMMVQHPSGAAPNGKQDSKQKQCCTLM